MGMENFDPAPISAEDAARYNRYLAGHRPTTSEPIVCQCGRRLHQCRTRVIYRTALIASGEYDPGA